MLNHFSNGNKLIAAVEKVISPLCKHIGFRTDQCIRSASGVVNRQVDDPSSAGGGRPRAGLRAPSASFRSVTNGVSPFIATLWDLILHSISVG